MMEKFRNLGHNVFFKIFLGFLGLTFVMFGISGFLLGSNKSWIAKVGDKTISYDKFLETAQTDKEAIYRSNPTKEVLQYLNSEQFKQDVLGRMVTRNLIKSLQEEFQIYPDKNLILREIASNPALKGKDGKFDRKLYQSLLKGNGITEKDHIDSLADEVVGGIIVQSFAYSPEISEKLAKDLYQHRFQTRNVDAITISTRNVGAIASPNDFELNEFFEKNKENFALPELRQISFLSFDVSNLKQEIKITDEEITKEYEANKAEYQNPETADFYHILFSNDAEAEEFYKALKADSSSNKADAFVKLANAKGKDKATITLSKISKKELPTEIAGTAFALEKDKFSDVVKSKLGSHIFYLVGKTPATEIPFAKVKDQIRTKLIAAKSETQIQDNLKKVEDEILASNSLEKVAEKLKTTVNKSLPKFSADGLDSRHNKVAALNSLDDLVKNSFTIEKGKVSKVFASASNKKYYIIMVDEIEQKRQRSLDEIQVLVSDLWIADKKQQKLHELASQVTKELNQNGGNSSAVASKYGLKVEKNRTFPRFYMIDAGNGRKVPYANKMLTEIFAAKLNGTTNPEQNSADELVIAVVKAIQNPSPNDAAVQIIVSEMKNNFRTEVLTSFNQYIQKKFPVEINKKLIQSNQEASGNQTN